ncbi:aldose 1-epimerase [Spiroplasma sp. TIUS-1]|uniref:aldose epimerase family protein n=1 Tax=Spiroplasma sp. TIUS-1 TaxID=216963 RepID=UPI00139913A5|nr:hypothetical protein [Spiroplasma sp. TIUS-1]QHX36028.1 aldose 1-epimerase [Spiroplasma sp. TIUS-1]
MTNVININNGDLVLSLKTDPVEMISLKKGNTEFLYQKEGSWDKVSPILFPICGKLKDDSFIYESKIYKMPKHGFVQGHTADKWTIEKLEDNKVSFLLSSDKELFKMYPFEFELRVEFELKSSNELSIRNTVINRSETKDLFYSFGHHPAFKTNKDGVVKYNKVEKFTNVFPNGFVDLNSKTYTTNEIKLNDVKWSPDINPAVIKMNSTKVEYRDSSREIDFMVSDFETMLLWSKDGGTKWLCFEPWNGLPDFANDDIIELSDKKGMVKVLKNESHSSNLLISLKTHK